MHGQDCKGEVGTFGYRNGDYRYGCVVMEGGGGWWVMEEEVRERDSETTGGGKECFVGDVGNNTVRFGMGVVTVMW